MAGNNSGFIVSLLFLLCCAGSRQQDIPRATTNSGVFLGTERMSETGRKIYSFTGIPYIQPPLGELRFKAPVPVEPFKIPFNASKNETTCPQDFLGTMMGTEDCVILNVFTPLKPSSILRRKSLAVMVFIHGGGFVMGSSSFPFTGLPDYLLEHNVVLVTINYRLGVFGFLSTGDKEAPGNYGLLDQVEALKWVKKNIAGFGGNPDQVTIFGESAGAAAVHYLMLSPLAKDLFHRAIAQSGTTLSPWARTTITETHSKTLAKKLNCSVSTSSEMLECLRRKNSEELTTTKVVVQDTSYPGTWFGGPRIDTETQNPFLPDHPINIMMSGDYNKVPLLIGYTKDEAGATIFGLPKDKYEEEVLRLTEKWKNTCKAMMASREYGVSEERSSELCAQVKEHYINQQENFEENKLQYVKMLSDLYILSGVYKSIELMADHNPIYKYVLNYANGEFFLNSLFDPTLEYHEGIVAHTDDLLYLFKYPQTNWTTASPAYEIVTLMTKIWTNFAKNGEPGIPGRGAWPRVTSSSSKYVAIDKEPMIKEGYRSGDMDFWDEVYSESLYNTATTGHDSSSAAQLQQNLAACILFLMIIYLMR